MKKFFRYLFIVLASLVGLIVFIALLIVIPIDRTPYRQQDFYGVMMKRLDSLDKNKVVPEVGILRTGFSKVNLTPASPIATAGYGNRWGKHFTEVLDSIYVRAIVLENEGGKYAIVNADLLIIPPLVTETLEQKLSSIGFSLDNTYLNASHTHNSIGNWAEGATGLIYGTYSDTVVTFIADKIVDAIKLASVELKPTRIKKGHIAVPHTVRHRIDKNEGHLDSLMRVVSFERDDSTRMVMVSYNAHPTCLFSKDLALSRDYPGELVDQLERDGFDFAMFLSGAVGSHGCNPPEYGRSCIPWMANELSLKVRTLVPVMKDVDSVGLMMMRVPLALGDPQVKVSEDWRLRPFVFNWLMGEHQPFLTGLRIGDIIMLGTPCDFSGELSSSIDAAAKARNFTTIITSFNGQYIGYITRDIYYDNSHYETRLMNWYGPGNGAYLTECLQRMVVTMTAK